MPISSRRRSPLSILLQGVLLNNIISGTENGDVMRSRIRMELIKAEVILRKMTMLATLVLAISVVV